MASTHRTHSEWDSIERTVNKLMLAAFKCRMPVRMDEGCILANDSIMKASPILHGPPENKVPIPSKHISLVVHQHAAPRTDVTAAA